MNASSSSPPAAFFLRDYHLPQSTTTLTTSHAAPKNILWKHLFRRDFWSAHHRLTLYPREASYAPSGEGGRTTTCLHLAARHRCPADLLLRVLALHPTARTQRDAHGWTPLHIFL
jgi:hypothetical protein